MTRGDLISVKSTRVGALWRQLADLGGAGDGDGDGMVMEWGWGRETETDTETEVDEDGTAMIGAVTMVTETLNGT